MHDGWNNVNRIFLLIIKLKIIHFSFQICIHYIHIYIYIYIFLSYKKGRFPWCLDHYSTTLHSVPARCALRERSRFYVGLTRVAGKNPFVNSSLGNFSNAPSPAHWEWRVRRQSHTRALIGQERRWDSGAGISSA